jgi:GNAT superfamily N-acetyltransferase
VSSLDLHGIAVRAASVDDAEAIANVHLDAWDWAYRGLIADAYIDLLLSQRAERVERWRANLADMPAEHRTWVALREGAVVGFCGTGPGADTEAASGTGEVYALYLRPDAVGTGTGRVLFSRAVEDLRARGFAPLTLWVLRDNVRARRFYEAAGWRPDGAEKIEERPDAELAEVRYRAP